MPADRMSIVAVISDLGTRDPALSQFKAAVWSVNPHVEFCDVSHEVKAHDLLEAAFLLERVFRDYPTRTAFVVLVDQVLAAPRRPLLAVSMDYYYFAPDNGVLSFVYEHDSVSNVYHVTAEHYIKSPPGPLAPHEDVYGPAVGWLTKGIESANFGDPVTDYVRTALPLAQRSAPNELKGLVLQVDSFGSLVTNVSEGAINAVRHEVGAQVPFRAVVGDKSVPVVTGHVEGGPDVIAVYGTAGYLEIVSARGDASRALNGKRGDTVKIVFGS